MAEIMLKHIYKNYGNKVTAVQDVNLDIKDKEFIVFVGPSGCGKSTLLRMIAGLEEISAGELYIGEHYVNDVPPKDRDIAMVFQNYALYPHMNVFENMAFGLKLRKIRKEMIKEKVEAAAKILDIEHLLTRKPKELSGGQRQRVALGRAIVREPQVFLMDEPLSNLDAKLRVQMRAEITKLHKRLETTVIYVTHDQTEAMTMANRIVVLKDGIIQQVGTPRELYQFPDNIFVGGFIGSPAMNFIRGRLERKKFIVGQQELIIPAHKMLASMEKYFGQDIILGIRPEHIDEVQREIATSDSSTFIDAYVDVAELMGAETYLYSKIGEQRFIARVDSHSNNDVQSGDTLKLAVHMEHALFFDPQTEKRLK